MIRYDVLGLPLVKRLIINRWPQFLVQVIALAGFFLAIFAGWVGTPVGSRNFAIVSVWIAWWAILMLVLVPLFGRGWCSICPIPVPGDWIQRGAMLGPQDREILLQPQDREISGSPIRRFVLAGVGPEKAGEGPARARQWPANAKRWPAKLRNIWLQNLAFAMIALFSTVILTMPVATAIILFLFIVIAVVTSIIFERRAFCRYLCPVGGFIGLYAQLAPVEVRVKDTAICKTHTEKTCYTGNSKGFGCPWHLFPAGNVKNTYCGMCMECLRTCPHDNIAVRIRNFGEDLGKKSGRKMDEAYKAFIMLGSAMVYSLVLLGPWGGLKSAAFAVGSAPWWIYALSFVVFTFAGLPGVFLAAILIARRIGPSRLRLRKSFINFAYALIPLGLAAWIAFSLSFVLSNGSYIWPVISDPLGWGWNLLGTRDVSWTPYLDLLVPLIQGVVLLAGLTWSCRTAKQIALEENPEVLARWQALPVSAYSLLVTVALMGLLIA